jgi:DNA repair protein RecO (recombination protein O)
LCALHRQSSVEVALRVFEKRLLQEIGYGLVLENDMTDNTPIDPAQVYRYVVDHGPVRIMGDNGTHELDHTVTVHGATLLALANEALDDATALQETKVLMRAALGHHLAGRPLNTRKLFRNIKHTPFSEGD